MVVVKIPAGVKKVMQIWTDTSAADRQPYRDHAVYRSYHPILLNLNVQSPFFNSSTLHHHVETDVASRTELSLNDNASCAFDR